MKVLKSKLKAKKTIVCKNVEVKYLRKDLCQSRQPAVGDVALFKVRKIGKHIRVQTTSGNNAFILPGDYIVAAFGNRYASEQFEGYVPKKPVREYHILGQGGAIGVVASQHQRFERLGPTTLGLFAYVTTEDGKVINTKKMLNGAIKNVPVATDAKVILSLGTSMDSGKTTTAGFLIHGLKMANKTAAYIKLTGTVYTRDKRFVRDYGANITIDFSDFGFPSTYMCSSRELHVLYRSLMYNVNQISPDYIVIEIADGLLQRETKMLLAFEEFKSQVYGVILSAADSLAAVHGTKYVRKLGYRVLGVSGLLTTSPLLIKEVKSHTRVPVLEEKDLTEKEVIHRLKL